MLEFNATFLVAMLSFVVFIFIMNGIFYKPILGIIKKRDDYINSNYNDAKEFESKTTDNINQYNQKLDNAKEQGRISGEKALDAVQKESFAKIQNAKEEAKAELDKRKKQLLEQKLALQNKVSETVENDLYSAVMTKFFEGQKATK